MHKFSKETQGLILGQIEIGPFGVVAQKRKEKERKEKLSLVFMI